MKYPITPPRAMPSAAQPNELECECATVAPINAPSTIEQKTSNPLFFTVFSFSGTTEVVRNEKSLFEVNPPHKSSGFDVLCQSHAGIARLSPRGKFCCKTRPPPPGKTRA